MPQKFSGIYFSIDQSLFDFVANIFTFSLQVFLTSVLSELRYVSTLRWVQSDVLLINIENFSHFQNIVLCYFPNRKITFQAPNAHMDIL